MASASNQLHLIVTVVLSFVELKNEVYGLQKQGVEGPKKAARLDASCCCVSSLDRGYFIQELSCVLTTSVCGCQVHWEDGRESG